MAVVAAMQQRSWRFTLLGMAAGALLTWLALGTKQTVWRAQSFELPISGSLPAARTASDADVTDIKTAVLNVEQSVLDATEVLRKSVAVLEKIQQVPREAAVAASTEAATAASDVAVPDASTRRSSNWQIHFNPNSPKPPWKPLGGPDPCVPVLGQNIEPRGNYQYVSSSLEQEWMETPRAGHICEMARKQSKAASAWMNYSKAIFRVAGQASREPTASEAEVLSYFTVGENPQKRWIEPLSGVARSPFAICIGGTAREALFDIQYLILENFCGQPGPKPHVVYFDLGCTSNGPPEYNFLDVDYRLGYGLGPSIPLFFNMYRDRCLEFDDIYGWEMVVQNDRNWWEPVPDHIRQRIRFYNVPVNETSCNETMEGIYAKRGSFLGMLPSAVKQEDFVVVKVDIDGGPELTIVEAIARDPVLSSLIDEIFFEYHFKFDGLDFGWGKLGTGRNVDTAIDLMKRLRQAGIRSHFWI